MKKEIELLTNRAQEAYGEAKPRVNSEILEF
jgi:hypothetical protein